MRKILRRFKNIKKLYKKLGVLLKRLLYSIFCLLPLQDKAIGSSFYGRKYENNARYVMEALHTVDPDIDLVWVRFKNSKFKLPDYIRSTKGTINEIYEYATAKVWLDSHQLPLYAKKRKGQLTFIIWHGGIGIKKIANDVAAREKSDRPLHTAKNTEIFVSNSNYRNEILRRTMLPDIKIWKCGYPKNDVLLHDSSSAQKWVKNLINVPEDTKVILYAPTYRLNQDDMATFRIDFARLKKSFEEHFGGNWAAIVHWHPAQQITEQKMQEVYHGDLIDLTPYDMQELILGCDAFISDYSSGIFDAAIREIPCLVYATDYDEYKETQGVYYEITDLPFPYCTNNDEINEAVLNFSVDEAKTGWNKFAESNGLVETGHSAEDISKVISKFVKGDKNYLDSVTFDKE